MTAWEIYLLLKLDDIHSALFVLLGLVGFIGTVALVVLFVFILEHMGNNDKFPNWYKLLVATHVLILLLLTSTKVLLPSAAQMAAILVIPPVVKNERLQQIPEKVLDLVEKKLDELKAVPKQ